MSIALPWLAWLFVGRRGYRALGSVLVAGAVGISGAAIYHSTQGGGGGAAPAAFSGTFDCYGTTGCASLPTPASCSTTIAASSLPTYLSSTATGGEVACLSAGTSAAVSLTGKSYSSVVTVQPANNATVNVGAVTLNGVTNLRFTGNGGGSAVMNMAGFDMTGTDTNDTFDHINYTNCGHVDIDSTDSNLLVDHVKFDFLDANTAGGICGSQSFGDYGFIVPESSGVSGIKLKITNSYFHGNCNDGIQAASNATANDQGVQVGPGNEFNMVVNCAAGVHGDAVQCNHGTGVVLVGNWFRPVSDGTNAFECATGYPSWNERNERVYNNVFANTNHFDNCDCAGQVNDHIEHNVFAGTGICWGRSNNNPPSGDVALNNVFSSGGKIEAATCQDVVPACGTCSGTYNLNPGSEFTGTGDATGTPTWAGGGSPSSYYDYVLAPSSPGYNAGSDGKSMGICSGCNGGFTG